MSRRLLLSYLLLALFVLAVLEIPLGLSYARTQRNDLRARLEHDAATFATSAEILFEQPSPATIDSVQAFAVEAQRKYGDRYVVVDKETRQKIVDSNPGATPERFDQPTRPEIGTALDGDVASGTRYSEDLGERLMYVAVPVSPKGATKGAVRVTLPVSAVDQRIRRFWLTLAAVAAVIMAAAALVGRQFARSITRPLQELEHAARTAGEGNLTARADPGSGPPEVRSLAVSFNETVAKLEMLIRSQEEFVADAAHQLRTPLAALQLGLENLEPDVSEGGVQRLETMRAEVARLARLVDGLLALARADASTTPPETVDLAPIISQRLDAWETYIADHYVLLVGRIGEDLTARATPDRVEQAVDNLLANALDVSPSGSTITVIGRRSGRWVEVHVVDEGPGMSEIERERAFDRLWRARPGEERGTGLGLAIVKRLVSADGGESQLLPASTGGLDAVLRLRAASSGPSEGRPRSSASRGEMRPEAIAAGERSDVA
jgi:signal transduction histidine kinase